MTNQPIISLEAITVRLREKTYLQDTSWQINHQENWVVMGPNGAGNTTLVSSLFGRVPVVKGRVIHHYKNALDSAITGGIGYVSPDQHREILEKENMLIESRDFSGNIDKITSVKDVISERAYGQDEGYDADGSQLECVTRRLQLESILDRNILSISSGEMAKTLIARALMRNPRLLILDEPFDGLDVQSRRSLQNLLNGLMHDQVQIVLITHRFDEIMPNISHVLFLKDGNVYRSGKKNDVLTQENINAVYGAKNNPLRYSDRLKSIVRAIPAKENEAMGSDVSVHDRVLIKLHHATVRYGEVVVLDKVDWTVKDGENWMIFGPNGAGKTTLLKLITGDNLQAYANKIFLFGKRKGSGENIWEIKQKIGFISSELQARYPKHVSAFDVVCSGFFDSIGLYRRCSTEQRNIARGWIETMGIADLSDQRFEQLSHGQRQLVLLARAMVKSPTLLMLDEPCDGLDIANRDRLLEILDFIGGNTDTNLIYVTHHEEETIPCISQVLFLDRGKITNIVNRS